MKIRSIINERQVVREVADKQQVEKLTHEVAEIRAEIKAAREKGDKDLVKKLVMKVSGILDRIQGLREGTAHTEATLSAANKKQTRDELSRHRDLLVQAIEDGDEDKEAMCREVIADCEAELKESLITEAGERDALQRRIARMKSDLAEMPKKPNTHDGEEGVADMKANIKRLERQLSDVHEGLAKANGEMNYSNDAHGEYSRRFANIEKMMGVIKTKLSEHSDRQTKDTKNWGYAGDLEYVEATLKELVDALSGV